MVRRSISAAHHPLQIISLMLKEKGLSGLPDGPHGLFGQSAVVLAYLQSEAMEDVLVE